MRFCLACYRFSGGGPICTQCGRSFGGRLCKGKTRHLNPPDAVFCNHCGATELDEAATSLPFGWVKGLVLAGALYALACWVVKPMAHSAVSELRRLTGFLDPRIWLMERVGQALIVLFTFYFLSGFIPGEAGQQFRKALASVVDHAVKLAFRFAEQALLFAVKLLAKAVGVEMDSKKKKKH